MLPAPWARKGWLTPGGAIDPGETPAQAASRELAEETGHLLPAAGMGTAVAVDSGTWQAEDGAEVATTNWYFFARVATRHINLSGLDDRERRDLLDYRWWSMTRLCATHDLVFPVGLVGLLQRLTTGDLPLHPVQLPWT